MANPKVYIAPVFNKPDDGDGGIRRIVEAQHKYLPDLGIDIVRTPEEADIIAMHGASWTEGPKGVAHVAHCHGLYWEEYNWPEWGARANREVVQTIHKSEAVTAPSEWVAQAIRRNMWVKPTVIPHGVAIQEWPPVQASDVGNYVLWNKTRVDAVCNPEAVTRLALMAGDTRFISTFNQGADLPNLEVTGRLPFDKAKAYIKHAGIYLCTTRETFGIGTIEAMACGVPVLGWNFGGQSEFVTHDVGWLSEPGDYEDLLKGLRYIQENRERLSKNARALIEQRFTWDAIMPQYGNLYTSLAGVQPPVQVSVVIPSYNLGQYLSDAFYSVYNQENPPTYEVIIVDDASTDDSLIKANMLRGQHPAMDVSVISNEKNQYLAGALNTGIAQARGKYVIPLDADNLLGPRALRVLSDALDNSLDLDIVYGKMEVFRDGEEGTKISDWPPEVFSFKDQMQHRNQISSTAMFRKKIWERVGGYRRRCRTAEDADFWCRATSYGARAKRVTDAVTLRYRDRADSMSHVNKDWPWHLWYPWNNNPNVMPPYYHMKTAVRLFDPLISVVIPVGPGHEHIVVDAIDSIVAQTFTAWEVIVINDTGHDIPWLHPFVRVIDTKGRAQGPGAERGSVGVQAARNLGIAQARGKLFIPLDADDYLEPDALGLMFDAQVKLGGYIYSDWYVAEKSEAHETLEFDKMNLLGGLQHASTILCPVEAWKAVGGYDEALDTWEDWDFTLSIVSKGYCGSRVPRPLLVYRVKQGFRRERLYADVERAKGVINDKWHEYISGEKDIMGCGCATGITRTASKAVGLNAQLSLAAEYAVQSGDDMTLLEYTGTGGTRTFVGRESHVTYRFGDDPDHRVRYVHNDDIPRLLELGLFKLFERDVVLI